MKNTILLFSIFIGFNLNVHSQNTNNTLKKIQTLDITLDSNLKYGLFTSNNKHLMFIEFYTGTIYIYNFGNKKLANVNLKKGRGPREYLSFTGSAFWDDDIYILDHKNGKLLNINKEGKILDDVILPLKSPIRLSSDGKHLIIMESFDPNYIFHAFNPQTKNTFPLKMGEINPLKEFKNFFYRDGYQTFSGNSLIHLTKYKPNIYVFNGYKLNFLKKVEFDESDIEEIRTAKTPDGAKVFSPPAKVDILSENVAAMPNKSNRILILARGASDNRDYDLDKLYEYDFEKEKFITKHNLGVKAEEITANKNFLFVYSKDENKIFQYEFINSEKTDKN